MMKINIRGMNIRPYVVYHGIPYQTKEYQQMISWCSDTFGVIDSTWCVNNIHGISFANKEDAKIFELCWRSR